MPKEGRKHRKIGRNARRPSGKMQWLRTYLNKLIRVNKDRAKSNKPPLNTLANYNPVTGVPAWKEPITKGAQKR